MRRRHRHNNEIVEGDWRPVVSPPQTPAPRVEPGGEYNRKAPVYPATIEGNVLVPVLQAIAVAAFVFVTAGLIAWYFVEVHWKDALVGSFVLSTGVGLLTLLGSIEAHYKLLWSFEEMIGADLNQDGKVGRPTTTIEVYNDNRSSSEQLQDQRREHGDTWTHMDRLQIETDPHKFKRFAEAMNAGSSLSVSRWTNGQNGIFTRGEFDAMIDELSQRGLIEYKDPDTPQLGRIVTERGKHVFGEIARKQLPRPADD